jgi:hypothetical protein
MATAKLTDKNYLSTVWVKTDNYSRSSIVDNQRSVVVLDELPFRIRFTNIMVPGYGPNNVPPIGIAIVGYNNYIL